jgi:hypothetical protein
MAQFFHPTAKSTRSKELYAMKTLFSATALAMVLGAGSALAATPSACDALSTIQLLNCGFETGDFTSWTVSGTAAVLAQTNLYGVDAYNPATGTYGAFVGTQGATLGVHANTDSLELSQNFSYEAYRTFQVTFSLAQDSPIFSGYTDYFQAQFDGSVLGTALTAVGIQGYTTYTFDVTTAASGSNTLAFYFQDDAGFWSFDDVSLTEIPEPGTWALLAGALGMMTVLRLVGTRRPRASLAVE